MKEPVTSIDGHLELPLLVRNRNVRLPNNRAMAENSLKSLKRRLAKDVSTICGEDAVLYRKGLCRTALVAKRKSPKIFGIYRINL